MRRLTFENTNFFATNFSGNPDRDFYNSSTKRCKILIPNNSLEETRSEKLRIAKGSGTSKYWLPCKILKDTTVYIRRGNLGWSVTDNYEMIDDAFDTFHIKNIDKVVFRIGVAFTPGNEIYDYAAIDEIYITLDTEETEDVNERKRRQINKIESEIKRLELQLKELKEETQ